MVLVIVVFMDIRYGHVYILVMQDRVELAGTLLVVVEMASRLLGGAMISSLLQEMVVRVWFLLLICVFREMLYISERKGGVVGLQ